VRVLVTGATGFTGGHLARGLLARGDDVRLLVRDPARAADLQKAGATLVQGDLAARDSLARAVEGVEVVYNIAALYREAGLPIEAYRTVNAVAVGWLIEAAAQAGVTRLVHCSTVGVHGDIEQPPANEDAPLRPGDVYQETKVEGEQIAREASARTGLGVAIRFVILGRGEIFYHLTYIDDLVDGFRLCGTHPKAAGQTYILSGPEVTTLNELVAITASVAGVKPPALRLPVWPFWLAGAACEAVCGPLGIEPPIYRRRVDFFTKSRAFDSTRAHHDLGYAPRVGLREGIGRTLAWYNEQGWL
jgi:nucleoside-diphosphate-sugar epimerase